MKNITRRRVATTEEKDKKSYITQSERFVMERKCQRRTEVETFAPGLVVVAVFAAFGNTLGNPVLEDCKEETPDLEVCVHEWHDLSCLQSFLNHPSAAFQGGTGCNLDKIYTTRSATSDGESLRAKIESKVDSVMLCPTVKNHAMPGRPGASKHEGPREKMTPRD